MLRLSREKQVESPAIRANPDIAVVVLAKRFHITVTQAVARQTLPVEIELFHTGRIAVDSAAVGAYP